MTEITPETLKQTRKELIARRDELIELQGVLANGDASVLDRHALVMEQILELKKTFIEQRDALAVRLPDGTRLWRDQYEALERFASNNNLSIETVLSKITVEGGVVTECYFSYMNLSTVLGLEGLVRLRQLSVSGNKGLTSLKGIPTQAIEEINANWCGLTGDLSALSGADKLKELRVSGNSGLTSLKGIPTRAIEEIYGSECGLTGDHTFLSKARNLKKLRVEDNPALTLDKTKFNGRVDIDL
jgi:hypothetical protein